MAKTQHPPLTFQQVCSSDPANESKHEAVNYFIESYVSEKNIFNVTWCKGKREFRYKPDVLVLTSKSLLEWYILQNITLCIFF